MIPNIYLLSECANPRNLKDNLFETEHESIISFYDGINSIKLSEINSLVEDRYSLSIHSARFSVEGNKTEVRQGSIHHHNDKGHKGKHLQFKLKSEHKVIRINIDPIDAEDYIRCIKGFIYISKKLIEQIEHKLNKNIVNYFFIQKIEEYKYERIFLLNKIRQAFEKGNFLDDNNKIISNLDNFKSQEHLLLFFDW